MKLRMLVIVLTAALAAGCASTDKGPRAYQIEPVSKVSHGGASNAQSYYQLGRYYHGQKRFEQAEIAYRKSLALDASQAAAHNALGSLYAERGELTRAVQHFEKALAAAPDAAYLHNNLGFAYYLQGRLQEAHESVRKALALDATLERGWANLQKIADHRTETQIAVAPKPAHIAAPAATPVSGMKAELATPIAPNSAAQAVSLQPASAEGREEGRFVLVSTSREVVNLSERLVLAKTAPASPIVEPPRPAAALPARDYDADVSRVSIEVSNGNGVEGFARKFSARLREDGIPVRRITNHASFQLKDTVVEYQPGYQDAANALIRRLQLDARVTPAPAPRAGAHIRILLGRDSAPLAMTMLAKAR